MTYKDDFEYEDVCVAHIEDGVESKDVVSHGSFSAQEPYN